MSEDEAISQGLAEVLVSRSHFKELSQEAIEDLKTVYREAWEAGRVYSVRVEKGLS